MVICPVCNKENNNEEYCTDCGTKLGNIEKIPIFEFEENKDISNVDELNNYLKQLNKKINKQKRYLDELNNDPLIKEYETISKINEENNKLKKEIKKLDEDNDKISLDLKKEQKRNSKLQSEINRLRNEGTFTGVIKGIFGNNNNHDANYCPKCGYKLS